MVEHKRVERGRESKTRMRESYKKRKERVKREREGEKVRVETVT